MTKHQYYLQLRKDILEERMRCDTENAMLLASLALQVEFGDYQPEVNVVVVMIIMSSYFTDLTKEMQHLISRLFKLIGIGYRTITGKMFLCQNSFTRYKIFIWHLCIKPAFQAYWNSCFDCKF